MATDQGKTANVNGLAIMAALTGRAIPEVGTTLARPPYTPVALGALAGPHRGKAFRPTRLTAGHAWAAERGAMDRLGGAIPWSISPAPSREAVLSGTVTAVDFLARSASPLARSSSESRGVRAATPSGVDFPTGERSHP
jgi:hypothetical protein